MILKALTLENFKGIREPVRVEFAPLTLLFGPNNAGKSTIVQALMYAREVLERNNCDAGRTQLGGEIVDLGGFENIVHAHDLSRPIRMRFELDLRGVPAPEFSRWIAKDKFESQADWQFDNAPKRLEWYSSDQVWSRLQEVWVEIEVAWQEAKETNREPGVVVRSYSVGKGPEVYATLSLSDQDAVELSYFNFGIYPFGTRYTKGDATDFEWDLQRIVRDRVRAAIQESDQPGLGLKKGARVAMQGDRVGEGENTLPRSEFDKLVSRIANGEGAYGQAAAEEDGREQNPQYEFRQALVESARLLVESRRNLAGIVADLDLKLDIDFSASRDATPHCDEVASAIEPKAAVENSSIVQNDPSESEEVAESDEEDEVVSAGWEDRRSSLSYGLRSDEQQELDSWMLDLFDALVMEDYVPYAPAYSTPLKLRGSALPKWGKFMEIGYEAWIPYGQNEFWENPPFVEEYLNDLLTTIIAGPGERLLDVLTNSVYISPFREMPPRHYQPARSPEQRCWANGLAAWDWLLLEDKSFAARVNEWLSAEHRFNAGYDIDVRHYRELEIDNPVLAALTTQEQWTDLDLDWVREQLLTLPEGRRLKISDLRSGVSLFPQDLGVGISQVIPVIVAALHNNSGIVAIEEPESNIHPAFQVVLADLFITQAKANPDALFLVETHSGHLMLRCLRRIRETAKGILPEGLPSVAPDDVAVHFVESTKDGPRIKRIEIDEEGDFIDEWPGGFFEESFHEKFAGR